MSSLPLRWDAARWRALLFFFFVPFSAFLVSSVTSLTDTQGEPRFHLCTCRHKPRGGRNSQSQLTHLRRQPGVIAWSRRSDTGTRTRKEKGIVTRCPYWRSYSVYLVIAGTSNCSMRRLAMLHRCGISCRTPKLVDQWRGHASYSRCQWELWRGCCRHKLLCSPCQFLLQLGISI